MPVPDTRVVVQGMKELHERFAEIQRLKSDGPGSAQQELELLERELDDTLRVVQNDLRRSLSTARPARGSREERLLG